MNYNSKMEPLAIPEYGRNIQNMVNYCMTIGDRDERNRCAQTIITIMGNMFPERRENSEAKHILWDHLAIMSGFKLDIDYPMEIISPELLERKPKAVSYSANDIVYRHYGHLIQEMILKACAMEQGEERHALELLIANQMKRSYLTWNKDTVDDYKIFKDLYELSEGRIELTEESCHLTIPNASDRKDNNNTKRNKVFRRK
ncbi:DUF4290 domain-containing protein [Porphyromonas gingivalis]|uniref:DUF4290 domain-containing protein n=1 Tax=Porphyromonas gingivalis TaxID=837 RepID=UPI000C18B164|nr:DUF4290 domain-containing protein [Porphyromonas gingivalis]ATS01096.1 hypothetical protein CS549_08560 [Porphyromonas gingivalis]